MYAVGPHVMMEHIPVEVQALLDDFQPVFEEPIGLPPHRSWDHAIPILPRAKLVNIRLYRYIPEQKDEIEKQVHELLQAGLIVHNASPYS